MLQLRNSTRVITRFVVREGEFVRHSAHSGLLRPHLLKLEDGLRNLAGINHVVN